MLCYVTCFVEVFFPYRHSPSMHHSPIDDHDDDSSTRGELRIPRIPATAAGGFGRPLNHYSTLLCPGSIVLFCHNPSHKLTPPPFRSVT